ncbi:MAG: hypothetical protein P4L53_03680 [Candidatus Obscuribacterales bacterium]|nr:hypothetical protein [Candidatus Obscuribacterales bacterium]
MRNKIAILILMVAISGLSCVVYHLKSQEFAGVYGSTPPWTLAYEVKQLRKFDNNQTFSDFQTLISCVKP